VFQGWHRGVRVGYRARQIATFRGRVVYIKKEITYNSSLLPLSENVSTTSCLEPRSPFRLASTSVLSSPNNVIHPVHFPLSHLDDYSILALNMATAIFAETFNISAFYAA
jgi:hypothetical protein